MAETFCVIGGDRRQAELARLLAADGKQVFTYGVTGSPDGSCALGRVSNPKVVILPLPLCRGAGVLNCSEDPMPTRELFRCLRPEQLVLAGQVKQEQRLEAAEYGLSLRDYFLREELVVANAAATAEGAVQIAMEHLDCMLLGLPCLVLGFGRIGKLLCHRLRGLGADVTAAARKPEDLAWIRAYGYHALPLSALNKHLAGACVVFNTIPSPVLDSTLIELLPKNCLCLELASERGINPVAAEERGLTCVWARSLPGRLMPVTAAEAIRDAVYNIIIEERGDPS